MNECKICGESLETVLDDYEISYDRDYQWHLCYGCFIEALRDFKRYLGVQSSARSTIK